MNAVNAVKVTVIYPDSKVTADVYEEHLDGLMRVIKTMLMQAPTSPTGITIERWVRQETKKQNKSKKVLD